MEEAKKPKKKIITKLFEEHDLIEFIKFCRLNILYLRRIRNRDLSVLGDLNTVNVKLFGRWASVLPIDAYSTLLDMTFDPKPKMTKDCATISKGSKKIKYDIFEGSKTFNRHVPESVDSEIAKLEFKLKNLKLLKEMLASAKPAFVETLPTISVDTLPTILAEQSTLPKDEQLKTGFVKFGDAETKTIDSSTIEYLRDAAKNIETELGILDTILKDDAKIEIAPCDTVEILDVKPVKKTRKSKKTVGKKKFIKSKRAKR